MAAIESFALCAEFAEIPSDTLIIDGDTIYIEKDQVLLPNDSLSSADLKLNRVPKHLFSATAAFGLNATRAFFELGSSEYALLGDFIGAKNNLALNPTALFDLGVRFLTIRGPAGNLELSLASGVCLNKLKVGYTSLKDPLQLKVDSILSFEASEGELMVQYFTITQPPNIGEVDTLYPQLARSMLHFSSIEASGKLRATLNRGPKAVRYFLETGIIKRFVSLRSGQNDIILLNEQGNWRSVQSSMLQGINMLVPHFAAGAEIKLSGPSRMDETFFTIGAQLNASLPVSTLSRTDVLSIATGNVGLSFCGRFFF
jgi:hypothetical protein